MAVSGYGWRCAVTVPAAQVDGTSDQANHPWLLTEDNLPSQMFDADGVGPALTGGGDIRVAVNADGTGQLPIEVVSFVTDNDPANGTAEIHVKSTLYYSVATVVYVFWGKAGDSQPAADAAYGAESVWNGDGATWEYLFIHHLETGLLDSTVNSIDATNTGTTDVAGTFGRARDWQSGTDKLDLGDVADTTNIFSGGGTAQCIFTPGSAPDNSFPRIFDKLTVGCWLFDNVGTDWSMRLYRRFNTGADRGDWVLTSRDVTEGTEYIFAVKYDDGDTANNPTMVLNGTVKTVGSGLTETTTPAGSADSDSGNDFYIGNRPIDSGRSFDGTIDEFRVADREHSDDWLTTDYNALSSPGTFASAGTVVQLVFATAAQTFPSLNQSATGGQGFAAAAAQALPAVSQAASGTGAPAAAGSAAQTVPAAEQAATGGQAFAGSAAQELPAPTQSGSGVGGAVGAAAQVLPAAEQAGAGGQGFAGSAAQTLPAAEQSGAGATAEVVGSANLTLPAAAQSAAVGQAVPGAAAMVLPALAQAAAAVQAVPGTGAQILPALLQAALAAEEMPGAAALTLPALIQLAAGNATAPGGATGAAALVLPAVLMGAAGTAVYTGVPGYKATVWAPVIPVVPAPLVPRAPAPYDD